MDGSGVLGKTKKGKILMCDKDQKEIERLQKAVNNLLEIKEEDSKFSIVIGLLVPNYRKYEDQAFELINQHGMLRALKIAKKQARILLVRILA